MAMTEPRHFPPPWTVEDHNDACFIVKDKNGYALAYVYYEEEAGRVKLITVSARSRSNEIMSSYALWISSSMSRSSSFNAARQSWNTSSSVRPE